MKTIYSVLKQTYLYNVDGSVNEEKSTLTPIASTDDETVIAALLVVIQIFQQRKDTPTNSFTHILSEYSPHPTGIVTAKFNDAVTEFLSDMKTETISPMLLEILEKV